MISLIARRIRPRRPGGKTIVYTQDRATYRESQAGAISHTGNPFDLALTGDGYFTVATKDGPRLTRDGRFGPLPDGTLADSSGNAVLDVNGKPIRLAPTDTQVTIAGDGAVSTENGQVGKIGVVKPTDPMRCVPRVAPISSPMGRPWRLLRLALFRALLKSNVQPVLEVTRMMDNMRQFQFVTQLVQAEGDRQQNTIDKLLPPGAGA